VLFFLFIGEFNIIKSLLNEENISLWKNFGWTLGALGLLNFIYGIFLTYKKKNVSALYGAIALLCYIPFIYLYSFHSEDIIPFSIPQWMIPGNMILYVGTFLMPTLAYSLFVLVVHFTPKSKNHKVWKNLLIAIIIPISWYLFSQIILPLWKPVENNFGVHTALIFIIIGTLIFLFFLIRGIYILATKKADIWQKYQLVWKIPISIILPLLGLAVNNGLLFNDFLIGESGIFGNFNSYWFYGLAIVNGVFICLPNLENNLYRLILFIGRSLLFAFTFYFFIVFLPFLPLSIIAIVLVGTGFLMLTPLLLFVIHINELSKDFKFLKNHFSNNVVWIISIISFLAIPTVITTSFIRDKSILNETLDYVYTPDYSKDYSIDEVSLQKTLNVIKEHKENNSGGIFGFQIPYISTYFKWLVLDNLTISDKKINNIEKIFYGKPSFELRTDNIRNESVNITDITTESTFDESQNAWVSWVNLEITNDNENNWFSEYATTINLPIGCWISDYYLYVGDKKEMGILAEKKSAMWIFSQIRNENKDPGILYYLTGNKVAFRVFPFGKNEVRKTGIEFLHKEPITLTIDGNIVELGYDRETITEEIYENDNLIFITPKQKENLKQVQRKPYFHFLIDTSIDKDTAISEYTERIEQVLEENKLLAENARISFVNSYVTSIPFSDLTKSYQSQSFKGGFNLERAIKKTLFNSYKEQGNSYPIIVVVTDDIYNSVLDKDFSDFKMTFPDNNLFFILDDSERLEAHSLTSNPFQQLSDTLQYSFGKTVLEYEFNNNSITYLSNNDEPSIVLKNDIFEVLENQIKENNWQTALVMQGKWNSQVLHPETSNGEWLKLVKYSFLSKIMTPVTSFLVVENEAQKAMLKKKQEQVLSGNKSYDVGEDTQKMSEPSFILLTLLLGLALWIREKRKRRITT